MVVAGPGAGKTFLFKRALGKAPGDADSRLILTFINNLKTNLENELGNLAQVYKREVVAGGRRALKESGGYFVEPTIFRDVPPSARIAMEEIFGPVLSVIRFDDAAEATRIANGTMYGLMAYVWTAIYLRA